MADDVQITAGSGTTIATDEVSSRHYQLVKLAHGADGSASMVALDQGLPAQAGTKVVSGSASANNTDLVSLDVSGYRYACVQLTGTFSATASFQASNDNTNWVTSPLAFFGLASDPSSGGSSVNNLYVGSIPGRYFRVRTTSYSSGTINASVMLSATHAVTWQPVYVSGNVAVQPGNTNTPGDNITTAWAYVGGLGFAYNGSGFERVRVPTTFKSAVATASGNTAAWTPTSGKKFRIMRYCIDVTGDAATASGGALTVGLQDATTDLGLSRSVYVPATAGTTMGNHWTSGWVDLGNGKLSAAANNVLNVNLSAALTSGTVRVQACGTEE